MVTQVKNVTLVGDHFLAQPNSPLRVSVLTRQGSDAKFPAGLNVISTDHSPASLEQSLKEQDVVIMLLPPESPSTTKLSSTRPSELALSASSLPSTVSGLITRNLPTTSCLPQRCGPFKHLEKTQDVMSWTGLMCNPWVDFCVVDGLLGFDVKSQQPRIYNGGDVPFSTGLQDLAAQALYALLTNPERFEEAKNKYIHVASYTVTQNQILSVAEQLTGQKWKVEYLTSKEVLPEALEDIKKGLNWGLGHQVQAILFDRGSDGHAIGDFRPLGIWNEKLNLPKSTLEQDLGGPLAGKWKGVLHWQPDELPNYTLGQDRASSTRQ